MRAVLTLVGLLLAAPALAETPREQLLASPTWLVRHVHDRELVILQAGGVAGYKTGHIPGARLVTLADVAAAPAGADALTLELPDPAALKGRLEALGVSDRSRIVVYPTRDGVQTATRVVFTLQAAGLGAQTLLLDGGLDAWIAAGGAVSTDPANAAPGRLSPLKPVSLVVGADFVRSHVNTPGYVVVDARAADFYSGARTGGPPTRPHKSGHIAGARSVPFQSVTTPDLRLAPAEQVRSAFASAGVKPGDTVITYCHIGQQASATLLAARSLGLNVLLYDGSFEDWSRRDGPVERSTSPP